MNYYCVHINFFDYMGQRAFLFERNCKTKPKNQFKRVSGLSAFKIWFTSRSIAENLVENIINKISNFDDIRFFFNDIPEAA